MKPAITLAIYNRRWNVIMHAFRIGALPPALASAAIADLTAHRIRHTPKRRARKDVR